MMLLNPALVACQSLGQKADLTIKIERDEMVQSGSC